MKGSGAYEWTLELAGNGIKTNCSCHGRNSRVVGLHRMEVLTMEQQCECKNLECTRHSGVPGCFFNAEVVVVVFGDNGQESEIFLCDECAQWQEETC
jgi:hypothetical protein